MCVNMCTYAPTPSKHTREHIKHRHTRSHARTHAQSHIHQYAYPYGVLKRASYRTNARERWNAGEITRKHKHTHTHSLTHSLSLSLSRAHSTAHRQSRLPHVTRSSARDCTPNQRAHPHDKMQVHFASFVAPKIVLAVAVVCLA